jgi:hypothetical protein
MTVEAESATNGAAQVLNCSTVKLIARHDASIQHLSPLS